MFVDKCEQGPLNPIVLITSASYTNADFIEQREKWRERTYSLFPIYGCLCSQLWVSMFVCGCLFVRLFVRLSVDVYLFVFTNADFIEQRENMAGTNAFSVPNLWVSMFYRKRGCFTLTPNIPTPNIPNILIMVDILDSQISIC